MNYYEHHLGDYVRDTAHLSMLEDGAYRRLLDAYYIKEVPIPAALRDAYRLARAQSKPERDAVQIVLGEFFEETPEGWRHKRCDTEIARFQDKRSKAQRSANARWGAQQSQSERNANASAPTDANAYPDAVRTQCEGNALQSPVTSHQEGEGVSAQPPGKPARKPPRASKRVPVDFEVTVGLEEWVRAKAPLVDWQRETEKFRDWEFKSARSDWPAAWRTWMRREQDEREKNGNSGLNGHAQGAFV